MKNRSAVSFTLFLLAILSATNLVMKTARAENVRLEIAAQPGEFVLVPIRLGGILALDGIAPDRLADVELFAGGEKIESQFIPDDSPREGTLIFIVPERSPLEIKPIATGENRPSLSERIKSTEEIKIERSGFSSLHREGVMGGFPSEILFKPSGKKVTANWNDRLYDRPQTTVYLLANDRRATVELVSDGPLATVVRSRAHYVGPSEKETDDGSLAVYDWFYRKDDSGLVFVRADYRQDVPRHWDERHFLEFRNQGNFPGWLGSGEKEVRTWTKQEVSHAYDRWGALLDGRDAITFFNDSISVHDAKHPSGTYLHAAVDFAWSSRAMTRESCSDWVRIGPVGENAVETLDVAAVAVKKNRVVSARLSIPAREEKIKSWREAACWRLFLDGDLGIDPKGEGEPNGVLTAESLAASGYFSLESEKLGLLFHRKTGQNADGADSVGMTLSAIVNRETNAIVTGGGETSLFEIRLHATGRAPIPFSSVEGWKAVETTGDDQSRTFRFIPSDTEKKDAVSPTVVVFVEPSKLGGVSFSYRVEGRGKMGGAAPIVDLTTVRVRLAADGPKPRFLWPTCSGLVYDPCQKPISLDSPYPTGFEAPMAWSAFWDDETRRGIYYASHDADGATKTLQVRSKPGTVEFFDLIPLGELTVETGKGDESSDGEWTAVAPIVLEPFVGDWFDAAMIYRDWVRREAAWFPTLGSEGRTDTPDWMKRLSVWALASGTPAEMITMMKRFKETFGVPGGVHWYQWHQIPFDNDYPHYFPTKPGFAEAVLEIQKEGDFVVMPYINGRLWDTRDKGSEDWLWTKEARGSATKDEKGEPILEVYLSKESDGSPVKLGVMCPTTDVWRNKVREIILRLMNDCHVQAVYIDQIAAAKPQLCRDASHAHPLGGGSWWTASYRDLLARVRTDMKKPADDFPLNAEEAAIVRERPDHLRNRVLTSECNAEPYLNELDGYLTWHWQRDGSVPAFSAVYGGAIQMFGRSYAGDALAWKMKAAEELVYGEQIGWFGPEIVDKPDQLAFIRPLVRFRAGIVDYFYRGEMARPPRFLDAVPNVTADWKWSGGPTPVTAPAVRVGSWRILDFDRTKTEKKPIVSRAILIFSNVTTETAASRLEIDWAGLGFDPKRAIFRRVDSEGKRSEPLPKSFFDQPVEFPSTTTWGIEITGE